MLMLSSWSLPLLLSYRPRCLLCWKILTRYFQPYFFWAAIEYKYAVLAKSCKERLIHFESCAPWLDAEAGFIKCVFHMARHWGREACSLSGIMDYLTLPISDCKVSSAWGTGSIGGEMEQPASSSHWKTCKAWSRQRVLWPRNASMPVSSY